jgi:hypothetical protein
LEGRMRFYHNIALRYLIPVPFYILLILSCYTYNSFVVARALPSTSSGQASRSRAASCLVRESHGVVSPFKWSLLHRDPSAALDMPAKLADSLRSGCPPRNDSGGSIIFFRQGKNAEKLCKNIRGRPQQKDC